MARCAGKYKKLLFVKIRVFFFYFALVFKKFPRQTKSSSHPGLLGLESAPDSPYTHYFLTLAEFVQWLYYDILGMIKTFLQQICGTTFKAIWKRRNVVTPDGLMKYCRDNSGHCDFSLFTVASPTLQTFQSVQIAPIHTVGRIVFVGFSGERHRVTLKYIYYALKALWPIIFFTAVGIFLTGVIIWICVRVSFDCRIDNRIAKDYRHKSD